MGCRMDICSRVVKSLGCSGISDVIWSTSSPSFSSDLVACRIVSHTFLSPPLPACHFYPFLNMLAQRNYTHGWHPQLCPMVGPLWRRLKPAVSWTGQPLISSYLLPMPQNLATYTQYRSRFRYVFSFSGFLQPLEIGHAKSLMTSNCMEFWEGKEIWMRFWSHVLSCTEWAQWSFTSLCDPKGVLNAFRHGILPICPHILFPTPTIMMICLKIGIDFFVPISDDWKSWATNSITRICTW